MKYLSTTLLCLFISSIYSQQLIVTEAKKVEINGFKKIKIGDTIPNSSLAILNKKGRLVLQDSSGLTLYFREGKHSIDSTYNSEIVLYRNRRRMSKLIQAYFPNGLCKHEQNYNVRRLSYGTNVKEKEIILNAGDILVDNSIDSTQILFVEAEIATFYVIDSTSYTGDYFIEIESFFGDIIDFKKIENKTFTIDLNSYLPVFDAYGGVLLMVYSQDKRNSKQFVLGPKR